MKKTRVAGSWSAFCLACLTLMLATNAARAVVIDGHMQDWDRYAALPVPADAASFPSELGKVEVMKLAQDDDFIYVYLRFARPRPFVSANRQSELMPGFWDDFSYIEIDRNGDGVWDYGTRMVKGKRIGVNNLTVLSHIANAGEGRIILDAEGRKDYRPLGPRAFFAPDGQSVELRIPRLPLRLQNGVIYLRAKVHYRDDRSGSTKWNTRYFPSAGGWVGLQLRPISKGSLASSDSPARAIEPVIPREEFESEVGPRYVRFPGAYIYPWRELQPSAQVETQPRESLDFGAPAEGQPAEPPRSVIMVTPEGKIHSGPPASYSDSPEEGQGVPQPTEPSAEAAPTSELHE